MRENQNFPLTNARRNVKIPIKYLGNSNKYVWCNYSELSYLIHNELPY